jgi:hypothetical protein
MMDRDEFRNMIVFALADHPEWLPDALSAVSTGMAAALHIEKERRSAADHAMLAALVLGGEKRVEAATRKMMNKIICEAIKPHGASPIEREFLARGLDQ